MVGNMVGNPASLLLAHQQLREAANQAYQNHNSSHLPPGLVQANKSHIHQQALANLNMRERAETKVGQPAFPGQPPPLADSRTTSNQPAFPGQPPPRHSSQARPSTSSSQPVFPGLQYSQQPSPQGYGHAYSPQAPSPLPHQ